MATDVSAPLPALDLQDQSIVTVTLSDPGAKITRMTIHGWQEAPPDQSSTPSGPVFLIPGPEAA